MKSRRHPNQPPGYEGEGVDDGFGLWMWPAIFILLLMYPFIWLAERERFLFETRRGPLA